MVRRGTTGIGHLCDLIDQYSDELEADFTQFYAGLDIADVWRGALHPRRALVLVEGLKHVPASRYRAMILGGPEHIGWGPGEYLLAQNVDATNTGTVVAARVAGGKQRNPKPFPRPVVKTLTEKKPTPTKKRGSRFDWSASVKP